MYKQLVAEYMRRESELKQQRQNNALPTYFESAGFDSLGGFDLVQFEPR